VRAEVPEDSEPWLHVVHTIKDGQSTLYINGEKRAEGNPRSAPMDIKRPARLWIGGWYNNYDYVGDMDEVRISAVARSADWVRLEYENQKPNQTLVGPLVQDGSTFSVSHDKLTMTEGETIRISGTAGGAQKIYWRTTRDEKTTVLAADRFSLEYSAGRTSGGHAATIRFEAIYDTGARTIEIPVAVKEALPEPQFVLNAPANWDGRETIEVQPQIANLDAMRQAGVGELTYDWQVSGLATDKDQQDGKLVLHRAQNSGPLTVTLRLSNGGDVVASSTEIIVREPEADAWVTRTPGSIEMPVDGQFYARAPSGHGVMHCRGVLGAPAKAVFLRVFADGKKFAEDRSIPAADGPYDLSAKLRPSLVKYRIEFGTGVGDAEKILHRADDILCGDAYLINGQSNALATDTREESPRATNEWVRSYGRPRFFKEGERENLWCKPVWKANNKEGKEYLAELGWWGMELGKQLVARHKVPVFIINGAAGGTRIDQHQRNDDNPTDPTTIYGRMLWRVKQAGLTHGIRAVLWHQGENDQGAAGPDGGYGWETYQKYFVEMSADWKRDFPNVSQYYVFQIWPNACSMGTGISGDMLREKQRTLPSLYSNMHILSTHGIRPEGTCHFPLEGWSVFADRVGRLIDEHFYDGPSANSVLPANLISIAYASNKRDEIVLEFDQPMQFDSDSVADFYLDGQPGLVVGGRASGKSVTLKLADDSDAKTITYLEGKRWNRKRPLLRGSNGVEALTFCKVPIR